MSAYSQLTLDAQTQRDLEIFAGSGGESGLFGKVDSTATRMGSNALRERFQRPLTSVDEIASIQLSLAFLRKYGEPFPFDDELLGAADKYLRSRIQVSKWAGARSRLVALAGAIRHQQNYAELSKGAAVTARLVLRARDYCQSLQLHCPGGHLGRLVGQALAITADLVVLAGFNESSATFWHVLKRDSVYRLQRVDQLRELVSIVAEIDALLAMSRFGEGLEYSVPEVSRDELIFDAEGLIHPMVESPVSNSLKLDAAGNVIYLTGPNMAGKTTFLKTVGIAQFLAQMGMRVPARRLIVGPVEVLFTGINTADDLSAGVSYYLAEVRRVKQAAKYLSSGSTAVLLFDEVFKGTNVVDATDATKLVVESCAAIKTGLFFFSSHLAEVAGELAGHGVQLRSFTGEIVYGEPVYSYKLQEGASDQRMGLHLLKHEGVLGLLDQASRCSVRGRAT